LHVHGTDPRAAADRRQLQIRVHPRPIVVDLRPIHVHPRPLLAHSLGECQAPMPVSGRAVARQLNGRRVLRARSIDGRRESR